MPVQAHSPWNRFWRYGPLVAWMAVIFFASTDVFSASHSGQLIRPLLLWLFPNISAGQISTIHSLIRKAGHLTEYAILGLLAARAFYGSAHAGLRRRWFAVSLSLIVLYAFSDEFHQSFTSSRTASVYDSFIDISGGLAALILYFRRHAQAARKLKEQL
ncbi:MAG TPA: VanZ family protein [Pyrinomonadaceae bacterium]